MCFLQVFDGKNIRGRFGTLKSRSACALFSANDHKKSTVPYSRKVISESEISSEKWSYSPYKERIPKALHIWTEHSHYFDERLGTLQHFASRRPHPMIKYLFQ